MACFTVMPAFNSTAKSPKRVGTTNADVTNLTIVVELPNDSFEDHILRNSLISKWL